MKDAIQSCSKLSAPSSRESPRNTKQEFICQRKDSKDYSATSMLNQRSNGAGVSQSQLQDNDSSSIAMSRVLRRQHTQEVADYGHAHQSTKTRTQIEIDLQSILPSHHTVSFAGDVNEADAEKLYNPMLASRDTQAFDKIFSEELSLQ